jgi:hypothetical protein
VGYQVGDKAGPRLASLIAQYVHATRVRTAPYESRVHAAAMQRTIDRAGVEAADLVRPIIDLLTDDELEGMHPVLAEYLGKVRSGRHQWQSLGGLLGGLAQSVLSQVISNGLAPVAYRINELGPMLVADPGVQAALWAAGIKDENSAQTAGQWQGLRGSELAAMEQLAESIPGAAELGDLVNRGHMSEAEATGWLHRGAVPAALRARVLGLREAVLPPDLAALAVLRGVLPHGEGAAIAARSGVSAADFQIMVDDTGEPLGLEQLLEARRRGFISTPRLVRGILQSRVRDEWVDVAEKLAFSPPSTADAIQGVVQGHIEFTRGETISLENGLEPGNFEWMYETAGEPLSRTELEELYNRGEISEATVKQGLRESRLKNKYVDDAFRLHVRLPEPRQIVSALTHGAITKADAMSLLRQHGFTPAVAAILIAEGSNARVSTHHGLTLAEIRQLYADQLTTKAEAARWLAALGYDAADANRLFGLWDFLAAAALTRAAVGVVRAKYVSHHIDAQQVVLELDQLGIAAAARDRYLKVWNLERAAATRQLTEAQILKAIKLNLPGADDAWGLVRLTQLGYSAGDAGLLLAGA